MANSLPEKFLGTFKLERSENFDEYLSKRGVPWIARKMMNLTTVTKVFSANEDPAHPFKLDTITTMKTISYAFQMEESFEKEGFDGKIHRITFTVDEEGNLLEEHVRIADENDKGETYKYIRDGEYLIMQMECDGVVCKRFLKKVN